LTPEGAVSEGLLEPATWDALRKIALELFTFGQQAAAEKGLILVDTKYEFGQDQDGKIFLIDEIHTPDSSRYWLVDTYEASLEAGQEPDNYDKEFLRLWFKSRFDPYSDKPAPEVPAEIISELGKRYVYIYERLTGEKFKPETATGDEILKRIDMNVRKVLPAPTN
jgi:phosphoribosylaminoimidazole-succinocarboxamide synthase